MPDSEKIKKGFRFFRNPHKKGQFPKPASRETAHNRNTIGAAFTAFSDFIRLPEMQQAQQGREEKTMDRETARQEIRRQVSCKKYLRKSRGGQYICPFCGSGTGNHATGALSLYETNTWHCFSCDRSGDVIDLYRQDTGADFPTALSLLADEAGIIIDEYTPASPQADFKEQGQDNKPAANKSPAEATENPTDYTPYYLQCRERITDPAAADYLKNRGISTDTAKAYYLGFDPQADPAGTNHPCPRLIIPTSKAHYIGRSTDPNTPPAFQKMNPKGSSPDIFNLKALYAQDVQEVFICEGAFDALSLLEIGRPAVALNSTSNAGKLIKQLERKRTAATLILCLDNDEAGKKAAETLKEGLRRLNISHISGKICGQYKDPNEALTGDKEAFIDAVSEAIRQAGKKPDNTQYYIDALMTQDIERFKDERQTGFADFDRQTGGLYAGLYVLAAISSLGKTSFALQLADQLAEAGHDVIFFSLEQSRLELVSKSLARRTAQADINKAVTSLSIRKGYLPAQVVAAAQGYKEAIADRLSIIEGNFNCNISFIGDYVRQYIQRNETRPVVIIDYLQILQPAEDKRQTTKEVIDTTVTELKRLSREQGLTIIAVSSVNRANYLQPIDFESLKESGGIEYTADCVFGMQLQCLNDDIFSKEGKLKDKRAKVREAKAENPRKIELLCLKNRYGKSSFSCYFNYYPANDLFTEDTEADFTEPDRTGAITL